MNRWTILIIFFILTHYCVYSQEIEIKLSLYESLVGPLQETIDSNSALNLDNGQWTNLDRTYNLPRFQQAMDFIVTNNRADLLLNLTEISAYYSFLGSHPKVVELGSRWQNAASNTTNHLRLLPYATMANIMFANIFLNLNEDDPNYREYKKIMDQGISTAGAEFMNGIASKSIVQDVTNKYFSPLIRGELVINDAFLFDADVLYREQYITLQPNYYSKFNDFDELLMIGYFSEIYAQINWQSFLDKDFDSIDLRVPSQRFVVGMRVMGYPKENIFKYLKMKESQ